MSGNSQSLDHILIYGVREVSLFQGCPYRGVPLYIVMYTQQVCHVLLYTDMYVWYNDAFFPKYHVCVLF